MYQDNNVLRDQTVNTCYSVKECKLALFKPALTYEGIYTDLRAVISTTTATRENHTYLVEDNIKNDNPHYS